MFQTTNQQCGRWNVRMSRNIVPFPELHVACTPPLTASLTAIGLLRVAGATGWPPRAAKIHKIHCWGLTNQKW
jgi:hypothetical protein